MIQSLTKNMKKLKFSKTQKNKAIIRPYSSNYKLIYLCMVCVLSVLTFCLYNYLYSTRTQNRVFAKAEFTNPIPQKIRRTKKYWIPQNKGHESHNIFKFCGTTPQIIPTHVFFRPVKYFVENRFRFRKSIYTSDSTNKIRTIFVKFRFVNSAFANTLLRLAFYFWLGYIILELMVLGAVTAEE